jgi:putative photosynthetic complex assembly protein 2
MATLVFPILYTLFVWWFSTGVILYLDGLPRSTYRWTMLGATAVLAGACYGLVLTRLDTSVVGAYVAFTCGVLVWGWQEVGFLMGSLTGPRRTPCPEGAGGWSRFRFALETICYHELSLVALAVLLFGLVGEGPNQLGFQTYLVLWVMRQSAKLNLFFGVRNLNEEFLPAHLHYLASYYRKRAMNAFFPLSVGAATIGAISLWRAGTTPEVSAFAQTGIIFLGTMLTLAIIEHGFLMLPLPSVALWKWSLSSRASRDAPGEGGDTQHRVALGVFAVRED